MANYGAFITGSCNGYHIDIDRKNYTGEVITPSHISNLTLNFFDGDFDSRVSKTTLDITFLDETYNEHFKAFFTSDATMFRVVVSKGNSVIWRGYITPESYSFTLGTPVSVTARDNVGYLGDVDFKVKGIRTIQSLIEEAQAMIGWQSPAWEWVNPYVANDTTPYYNAEINCDYFEGTWLEMLSAILNGYQLRYVGNDSWQIIELSTLEGITAKEYTTANAGSSSFVVLPGWHTLTTEFDYGVIDERFNWTQEEGQYTYSHNSTYYGDDYNVQVPYYSLSDANIEGDSVLNNFTYLNGNSASSEFYNVLLVQPNKVVAYTADTEDEYDYPEAGAMELSYAYGEGELTGNVLQLEVYNSPIMQELYRGDYNLYEYTGFATQSEAVVSLSLIISFRKTDGTYLYFGADGWMSQVQEPIVFSTDPTTVAGETTTFTVNMVRMPDTAGDMIIRLLHTAKGRRYASQQGITSPQKYLHAVAYKSISLSPQGGGEKLELIGKLNEDSLTEQKQEVSYSEVPTNQGGVGMFAFGLFLSNNPLTNWKRGDAIGGEMNLTENIARAYAHTNDSLSWGGGLELTSSLRDFEPGNVLINGVKYVVSDFGLDLTTNYGDITAREAIPYIYSGTVWEGNAVSTGTNPLASGDNTIVTWGGSGAPITKRLYELPIETNTQGSYVLLDKVGNEEAKRIAIEDIVAGDVTWDEITDKPTSYPPSAHNQAASTITDLTETVKGIKVNGALSADSATTTNSTTQVSVEDENDAVPPLGQSQLFRVANSTTGGGDGFIYAISWSSGLFVSQYYYDIDVSYLNAIRYRENNGNWTEWRKIATTLDNVVSATKLQTARMIGNAPFNGTKDISLNEIGVTSYVSLHNTDPASHPSLVQDLATKPSYQELQEELNPLATGISANTSAIGNLNERVEALNGAAVLIGTINLSTSDITNQLLNDRAIQLKGKVKVGYTLTDSDSIEWWCEDSAEQDEGAISGRVSQWNNIGQNVIGTATNDNPGVVQGSDEQDKVSVNALGQMVLNTISALKIVGEFTLNKITGWFPRNLRIGGTDYSFMSSYSGGTVDVDELITDSINSKATAIVQTHNSSETAHSDIRAELSSVTELSSNGLLWIGLVQQYSPAVTDSALNAILQGWVNEVNEPRANLVITDFDGSMWRTKSILGLSPVTADWEWTSRVAESATTADTSKFLDYAVYLDVTGGITVGVAKERLRQILEANSSKREFTVSTSSGGIYMLWNWHNDDYVISPWYGAIFKITNNSGRYANVEGGTTYSERESVYTTLLIDAEWQPMYQLATTQSNVASATNATNLGGIAASGYAITNHVSSDSRYGVGNATYYGHTKLSDTVNSTQTSSSGTATTPKAVYDAIQGATTMKMNVVETANEAIPSINETAQWFKVIDSGAAGGDGYIMAFRWSEGFCTQQYYDADFTHITAIRYGSPTSLVFTEWKYLAYMPYGWSTDDDSEGNMSFLHNGTAKQIFLSNGDIQATIF